MSAGLAIIQVISNIIIL